MDNLINGIGYLELQNLTEVNVNNIITSNIICDTIQADDGNIAILNSGTGVFTDLIVNKNFNASTGVFNSIRTQTITGSTGYFTTIGFQSATGNYANINFIDMQRLTGSTGFIGGFGANVINTVNYTGSNTYSTNFSGVNYTGANLYSTNYSGVNYTGSTGYFTNLGFISSTGINLTCSSITVPQGSAVSPSISILGDTNSGIFSSGADNIDISTGGVSRCNISNSGIFTQDIRVNSGINGQLAYFQPTTKYLSSYNQLDLPVSTATQNALNLKANIANPTFTGQLTSSGNIFLLSSGVDSEIKILTSDNRVSKLSLKEFTDSYGFELFYNGATNNLNLNRRNANNVNVYTTNVFDGYTNYNAPVQFSLGMSGTTGIFNSLTASSITGASGYFNSIGFQNATGTNLTYVNSTGTNTYSNIYRGLSYTGASGCFNNLESQNLLSIVVDSNNGNITNLNTTTANIKTLFGGTGYFDSYLQADSRIVNNYDLCRNILRFYKDNYYAGVSSPLYSDPLIFTNNFQNGLIISDSSFQSIVYLPARDNVVIPNGTPMYYFMNATNSSSISSIGTNLSSNLTLPGGNVSRTYIFIFNNLTSLYEYQGFVNASKPNSNQFNSRGNSFTLPQGRPAQFNLLSALTNGATEWTDDISVRNFTSTGANIAFIQTQVMTGATGFFGNLNTSEDRIHLGNLAGQTSQQLYTVSIGTEAGRTSQANSAISIGYRCGNNSQGQGSIAIGSESGQTSQRTNCIALGRLCGRTSQRDNAISIGNQAGNNDQRENSISIGTNAGQTSQNTNSIAIGQNAGNNSQASNSIAIGQNAGQSSQQLQSIAIGFQAGQTSQRSNSLAIGIDAGQTNQLGSCIGIGFQAGQNSQGIGCVAIGDRAGQTSQQTQSLSIGTLAGATRQGTGSVAIGYLAGQSNQSTNGVAIGTQAGWDNQNRNAIAIGNRAGYNNQSINSIVINATGNILNTDGADRCFIAPIRNTNRTESMRDMFYNVSTNEITFSTFQDLIGGPIAIGAVYTTLFSMAANANYLLSLNTRANDGNYGLFICYQEEGANGLCVAINQNNILIQTAAGSAVQIRTVNGATYNFYYSARRLL